MTTMYTMLELHRWVCLMVQCCVNGFWVVCNLKNQQTEVYNPDTKTNNCLKETRTCVGFTASALTMFDLYLFFFFNFIFSRFFIVKILFDPINLSCYIFWTKENPVKRVFWLPKYKIFRLHLILIKLRPDFCTVWQKS